MDVPEGAGECIVVAVLYYRFHFPPDVRLFKPTLETEISLSNTNIVVEAFLGLYVGSDFHFGRSAFTYFRGRYGKTPRLDLVYPKWPFGFGSRLYESAVLHSRVSVQHKRSDPR